MAIRQHKHSHDKMLTEIRNSQTLLLSFLLRHLPAYTTSRLYAVEPWRWTSPSFQPPRNWSPNFCQLHVRVYVSQRSSAAICNHMTWPPMAAWPSNRAWLRPGERMCRTLFFYWGQNVQDIERHWEYRIRTGKSEGAYLILYSYSRTSSLREPSELVPRGRKTSNTVPLDAAERAMPPISTGGERMHGRNYGPGRRAADHGRRGHRRSRRTAGGWLGRRRSLPRERVDFLSNK